MKPDIRIFKDLEKLSRHAANIFVEQAASAIAPTDTRMAAASLIPNLML